MKTPLQNIFSRVAFWRGSADVSTEPANYGSAKEEKGGDLNAEKVDTEVGEAAPQREQWGNPIEFLLSCVAMSVGLGNVWRFPFVAFENGGGAFLIPYILVLLFIGKPLYYLELCLGQFSSYGSVKVWNICPAFKGVGYGQMIATWAVVTYYVSLMALTVMYFFSSFQSVLPWSSCGNWSTNACVDANINVSSLVGVNVSTIKTSSDEFFNLQVLQIDPNGLDNGIGFPEWRLTLCLLFSWIVLFIVLVKGVASSGKAAYFTAIFPYVVLITLLIRGLTLPGAINGIVFFLNPEWHRLLEMKVWYAAVSQSFFSLSVGFGSIIMFSSYNNFRHNVYRDAAIISVTDTCTSLLAGLTIFSILGHLAHVMKVEVKQVIKGGGTSLAFISYPDVLARFDWAPQFFAVMFFLMLFTLGVGSASALTGCVITIIHDQFQQWNRAIITLVVCVVGFFLGLFYVTPQGQYILTLVDHYGGGFIIFILAVLEIIAIMFVYGYHNITRDIEFMLNRKTGIYWRICWQCIMPGTLIIIFFYKLYIGETLMHGPYVFGSGATAFGLCLTLVALAAVPILFSRGLWKNRSDGDNWRKALTKLFQPTDKWGPSDPKLYREYKLFCETRKLEEKGATETPPKSEKTDSAFAMENPVPVTDES